MSFFGFYRALRPQTPTRAPPLDPAKGRLSPDALNFAPEPLTPGDATMLSPYSIFIAEDRPGIDAFVFLIVAQLFCFVL